MKHSALTIGSYSINIKPEQLFMISVLFVNGGNYIYNLLLGRILGPAEFADAAILITLLLVLSFAGMTFQIVTAKYAVLFEKAKLNSFLSFATKYAVIIGLLLSSLIIVFQKDLRNLNLFLIQVNSN